MHSFSNQRLVELEQQRQRREKLQRQVARVEQEVREAQAQVERLARELARKERSVEGVSLAGLLAALVGRRAEQLDRGRQEVQVAQFRYEEARIRAEGLAAELASLQQELASLVGVEVEYQRLLEQKEAQIRSSQGPGAAALLRLDEMEQRAELRLSEIQEAKEAGKQADAALRHVSSALESAQGWGTFDLLGGGFIATAAKHSKMDEAQRSLAAAQQALARFHRELADVNSYIALPDVEISGLLRFADYFFDGLIVDWAVQNQINQSLRSVDEARRQVGDLLMWLDQQAKAAQAEAEQARAERARLIKRQ